MTPEGERRRPSEQGPRRYVWPNWVRIGYRFVTTPHGEKIARILIGLFLFGMVAGWLMFKAIQNIPPANVEQIEQRVEQIEREAKEAESTAKEVEEEQWSIRRRIERVEDVIITP